ncbi:conserved hypothetical protein [Candidatus Sulfotelmatomonas gaucii]|uniref:Uncharacterized protein n=1 Tax=Candidatus Sulfuritelmatomonas gaucii TaxID=2043161 RepID=A0A2N9L9I3_9BACT|nr:conserved hypothetical protein [Candidatus Sulfotelmatomonas gaucii]
MLLVLQIAVVVAVAFYLARWRRNVQRHNSQSWEALLAKLRPEWSARELSDHFLWQEGLSATPEDAWQRMEGPKGLWVMYQNARVMLEMADFAAKHCEGVDRLLVETLHSDAMQIRVCVLTALTQYAFTQASEGVRVNAFRAAAMYTGMAARMTQLLQEYAATMVPDFVAAM